MYEYRPMTVGLADSVAGRLFAGGIGREWRESYAFVVAWNRACGCTGYLNRSKRKWLLRRSTPPAPT